MVAQKRILVVDDEADFAALVQGNLEKEGFQGIVPSHRHKTPSHKDKRGKAVELHQLAEGVKKNDLSG